MVETRSLTTSDGVRVEAWHLPVAVPGGGGDERRLAVVLVHGFTLSRRHPLVQTLAERLRRRVGVVGVDLRGHGASGGRSTVGSLEVHDAAAAVAWARELGYRRVATVGASLGAVVALRHAAELGGVDAVVSVSGPAHWFFRGTPAMRLAHRGYETRLGRAALRWRWRTRVDAAHWDPLAPASWPASPEAAAARIAPVPLLVVHGDADDWFPLAHARRLATAAGEGAELWVVPGMGHGERGLVAAGTDVVDRIVDWVTSAVDVPA